MSSTRTPGYKYIKDADIDGYRATRLPTSFQGCTQLYQYFIKADGNLSCSCMRYWHILGDLRSMDAGEYFNGPMMRFIRECFAEGTEPFSFCRDCPSRIATFEQKDLEYTYIDLHVEPSNQCNLFCEACLCTFERRSANPPARVVLDFDLYEKALREIKRAGLSLRNLALVGFGEPLFCPRTPDMARLGRELFPGARIFVDTNCNFGTVRAEELANCGIDEVRLALDGVDQASYAPYRRGGDFDRAIRFTRDLVRAINDSGSKTKAVWKYILFKHNDSNEQIRRAVAMAAEIGIPITFDMTVGEIASTRSASVIEALTGFPPGCNIDPSSTEARALPLGDPEEGTALWRKLSSIGDVKPTSKSPWQPRDEDGSRYLELAATSVEYETAGGLYRLEAKEGRPLRWTNGKAEFKVAPPEVEGPLWLEVKVWPMRRTNLTVTVNGKSVMTSTLAAGELFASVPLTPQPLSEPYVISVESETFSTAGDQRTLGIALERVRLVQPPAPVTPRVQPVPDNDYSTVA